MIDLYYAPTANGWRAALALEQTGLAFRRHKLDLAKGDQKTPEFTALNPLQSTPVIRDEDGPGGRPLVLTQSVAILLYAAEKAGKLIPADALARARTLEWLLFAASDVAMTSGTLFQLTLVKPAPGPECAAHFERRLARFFAACDTRLAGRDYLADELTVADLALYPNAAARRAIIDKHGPMPHLTRWLERMAARPAVARAMAE
ncbi:MAG: glutathione S-transferase family protein [Burkholderiales bacterium]|nr:glutathione S-transferase family protein [Burkholderiales bacterium]